MQTIQVRATQNVFVEEAMANVGSRVSARIELMMGVSVPFYDFVPDVFITTQEDYQAQLLKVTKEKVINDFNPLTSLM